MLVRQQHKLRHLARSFIANRTISKNLVFKQEAVKEKYDDVFHKQERYGLTEQSKAAPSFSTDNVLKVPQTQTTVFNNGFRVVTEPRYGETSAVGLFIKVGSRDENVMNNGIAHFLEHMYFKGTKTRTGRDLEAEFENMGATLNAHTSREYTCFTTHCLKDNVKQASDALCDIIANSNLESKDIEAERDTILREKADVESTVVEVLFDEMHKSAYIDNTLGMTILGPEGNIGQTINRNKMLLFRDQNYVAQNMVLLGVGNVDHQELVQVAEKYFGSWPSSPVIGRPNTAPKRRTNFIGGDVRFDTANVPELHIAVGFEGPSYVSNDMVVIQLMQLIWGSYDKNQGCAKYVAQNLSRIIADDNLAYVMQPFQHVYSDTSIFGIRTISDGGEDTDTLIMEVVSHMARLAYRVKGEELIRAKNLL
ncbi:mitochondrial-processing peptidase subunit, partial [Acrasis kona]